MKTRTDIKMVGRLALIYIELYEDQGPVIGDVTLETATFRIMRGIFSDTEIKDIAKYLRRKTVQAYERRKNDNPNSE